MRLELASPRLLSVVLGIATPLLLLALKLNPLLRERLEDLENLTFDYRVQARPPRPLDPSLVLVGLTDYDLDLYHTDVETRMHHFRLLQTLTNLGARAALFDILFIDEVTPDFVAARHASSEVSFRGDEDLAFQMQMLDVYLPYHLYIQQRYPENPELDLRRSLVDPSWYLPYDPAMGGEFGEGHEALKIKIASPTLVASARGLGHINVIQDSDGVVREIPLLVRLRDPVLGDNLYPSISLRYVLDRFGLTMRDLRVRFGEAIEFTHGDPPVTTRIPINAHGEMLINFRGGREFTENPERSFSSGTLMGIGAQLQAWLEAPSQAGSPPEAFEVDGHRVPRSVFQGATVLIGQVAVGGTDIRATSIDRALPMITVHANVIHSILHGDFVWRPPWWTEAALSLGVGLLAGVIFGRIGYVRSFVVAPLLAAAGIGAAWGAFVCWSLWVPLTLPLLTLLVSGILILLLHLVTEEKRRAIIRQAFEAYTSPEVVDEILQNIDDPALWGAKRRVTTLFVDIRGFTTLTEQTAPEVIVEILNEYYQTAVDAIRRHGGIPNKFIGDAIMALFGAPRALPNAEEAACRAAVDIQLGLARLNRERLLPDTGRQVSVGIGVNTGEVIVGIVGRQKIEYTALGDGVNVASRLQGQARPGQILIGQSTFEALERSASEFLTTAVYTVRRIPEIVLRGLTRRFDVYELCYERRQQARG